MSEIYFTSDQHFGHAKVIEHCGRPFDSVEEMNEEIVRRHNVVVKPSDVVWHLGDFSLDGRMVKRFLPRLNGTHFLVPGNHDRCHPCHKKHRREAKRYVEAGFARVVMDDWQLVEVAGFRLCHLPYQGGGDTISQARPNGEERYTQHRLRDDGVRWLLCGHVHEHWTVRGHQINVGVDQWAFAPVHLDQLRALREKGAHKEVTDGAGRGNSARVVSRSAETVTSETERAGVAAQEER